MSAIVGDRDLLLQNAAVRNLNPRAGKSLQLNVSSLQFKVSAGVAAPAAIAIDVVLNGLAGVPTFTVSGANKLIGNAGLSRTLSYADVTNDAVQITASLEVDGQTYSATQTVIRVFDGAPGVPGRIGDPGPPGQNGSNGAAGVSNAIVQAYKRSAAVPADRPGDVTYAFASAAITVPAGDALGNGWLKTPPAGADPLYVCYASASGTGATDVIASAEWTAPTLLVQNGKDGQSGQNGANGMNSATVYIYQRTGSAAAPALPTAQTTYTFDPASLSGLNNGWVTSVPAAGGAYLWVSTATAASATASDVIAASEWAAVKLLVKDGDNGQPGSPGQNGQNGVTSVYARCWQWSLSGVPSVSGTASITFSTGAISSVPAGWSASKPAPPARGATLYEASVLVSDSTAAASKQFDWGQSQIIAIGYIGLDGAQGPPGQSGQNGQNGAQGASFVIAYCLIDGSSLAANPAFASVDGNAFPATGTWGEARAWQSTPPTAGAGQSVMQTNGVYNPAINKTVWGAPLLASWRVGELSAISANLGEVTAGRLRSVSPDGYQTVVSPEGLRTYFPGGGINVRIGWWG